MLATINPAKKLWQQVTNSMTARGIDIDGFKLADTASDVARRLAHPSQATAPIWVGALLKPLKAALNVAANAANAIPPHCPERNTTGDGPEFESLDARSKYNLFQRATDKHQAAMVECGRLRTEYLNAIGDDDLALGIALDCGLEIGGVE